MLQGRQRRQLIDGATGELQRVGMKRDEGREDERETDPL